VGEGKGLIGELAVALNGHCANHLIKLVFPALEVGEESLA